MTPDPASAPDDLVAGAVADTPDSDLVRVNRKAEFLPWHLPRKQLCRVKQWLGAVAGLKNELYRSRDPGHSFRYLSLPGDDLLDVRVLIKTFGGDGPRLSFLGFNAMGSAARRSESNLSLNEIRSSPAIYPAGTTVLDRRIEEIGQTGSVGYRQFSERAPFDAINLDLTASVVQQQPLTAWSVVQAIHNMIHEQTNRRREPWLLFITTPIGHPPRVDANTLRQLHGPMLKNSRHDPFREALHGAFGVERDILDGGFDALVQLDHDPFAKLVGLALSKWLIGLALNRADRWSLTLQSLYVYRVYKDEPDMYSFVFRFEPTTSHGKDVTGLTVPIGGGGAEPGEIDLAVDLLNAMGNLRDIDEVLGRDPALMEQAIRLTETLLEGARYDTSGYRAWVTGTMRSRGL